MCKHYITIEESHVLIVIEIRVLLFYFRQTSSNTCNKSFDVVNSNIAGFE